MKEDLLDYDGVTRLFKGRRARNLSVALNATEEAFYQQALALLGVSPSETIAIGDRLETDILGAVRAGISSLMVLSGVSSKEDLKTSDYQPNWVMDDIREVTVALRH